MKKTAIFLSFIAVSAFIMGACSARVQKIYPYPFDTAHFEFEITGTANGINSVYVKGDKSISEFHGTRQETGKTDALLINTGEKLYQIDLNAKTGIASMNPVYEELKKLPAGERMKYLTKLVVGVSADQGAAEKPAEPQPKGKKDIAGQTCMLYDVLDVGEVCLWNGVPIYSSVNIAEAGISNTSTAVKIETNIEVPDSKFNLPEGIKLQDMTTQA